VPCIGEQKWDEIKAYNKTTVVRDVVTEDDEASFTVIDAELDVWIDAEVLRTETNTEG